MQSAGLGQDEFLRVFDVGSGQEILDSIEHGGSILSVCFSPDGKSVATGSRDEFLRVFDVGSQEIVDSIEHGGRVNSVCFSPDGKSFATGSGDKFLRVFDVGSGQESWIPSSMEAAFFQCVFRPMAAALRRYQTAFTSSGL
jgi:WD40 repeat protein